MKLARPIASAIAVVLKWISVTLLVISAGALATLGIYDLTKYEPRRADVAAILGAGDTLDRSPPDLLRVLQRADAKGHIAQRAARVLLLEIDSKTPRRSSNWSLRWLLWSGLVKIHLSEREQLMIERPRIYFGHDARGYAAGALSVFGKRLDQLSDQELAQLVVIARWPTRYRTAESSAHVAEAASALLEQVRTAR